jgi:hypothetical protein
MSRPSIAGFKLVNPMNGNFYERLLERLEQTDSARRSRGRREKRDGCRSFAQRDEPHFGSGSEDQAEPLR